MPLDKNFMVVTVILGGLLVWSMTQKAEKPLEVPYDDKMDDQWDDTPLKDPRSMEAWQIIEYIQKKVEELISWRREMDTVFLSDDNPWKRTQVVQGISGAGKICAETE